MKTVYFHNPGKLDIRGAYIAGLSAKDSEHAIGKFGTGLKYAIASILRWGGAVSIETNGENYFFSKLPISFRGKAHDQVCMNGQELGFTTHYGHQWEPWQVFRELYSNALDEGGNVSLQVPAADTIITVHCPEVAECYAEKDTIILPSKGFDCDESIYNTHIFKAPSSYLFYRGVRVRKERCLFTWNLWEGVELTEDRSIEATFNYECAAARVIQASADGEFIAKALRASDSYFEGNISYNSWYDTSAEFITQATILFKQEGKSKLPAGVWAILCDHSPDLDEPEPVLLSPIQQKMLERAKELVCRMGFDAANVPIHIVKLQKNILGQCKNGQVYLSPQVFEQGTKQVVSTLLEEVLHHETGLKDCTYEMQTRLFNMIVSLYEEHVFQEAC